MRAGIRDGRGLPRAHYLEVRYEDLVAAPHREVGRITEMINLKTQIALDEALANLNQFRQESDPAIVLALHGTKDQIIRENEQALRRLKPCLEALIPKPRRKILGFS